MKNISWSPSLIISHDLIEWNSDDVFDESIINMQSGMMGELEHDILPADEYYGRISNMSQLSQRLFNETDIFWGSAFTAFGCAFLKQTLQISEIYDPYAVLETLVHEQYETVWGLIHFPFFKNSPSLTGTFSWDINRGQRRPAFFVQYQKPLAPGAEDTGSWIKIIAPSKYSTADLVFPFVPWEDRKLDTDWGKIIVGILLHLN